MSSSSGVYWLTLYNPVMRRFVSNLRFHSLHSRLEVVIFRLFDLATIGQARRHQHASS